MQYKVTNWEQFKFFEIILENLFFEKIANSKASTKHRVYVIEIQLMEPLRSTRNS